MNYSRLKMIEKNVMPRCTLSEVPCSVDVIIQWIQTMVWKLQQWKLFYLEEWSL